MNPGRAAEFRCHGSLAGLPHSQGFTSLTFIILIYRVGIMKVLIVEYLPPRGLSAHGEDLTCASVSSSPLGRVSLFQGVETDILSPVLRREPCSGDSWGWHCRLSDRQLDSGQLGRLLSKGSESMKSWQCSSIGRSKSNKDQDSQRSCRPGDSLSNRKWQCGWAGMFDLPTRGNRIPAGTFTKRTWMCSFLQVTRVLVQSVSHIIPLKATKYQDINVYK